jgi:4,5-DOPA dioxygenase extradiol
MPPLTILLITAKLSKMTNKEIIPGLFVSHGAPTLALERNETTEFLRRLGAELGRPRAVLCVSAHWTTPVPMVSAAKQPETIHDFGGFPEALYQMRYKAPGAPELASRVAVLLKDAGIECQVSQNRGLDHGAWIPLMLMYPDADIPVTQLSVQPQGSPSAHFRMGQALAPLRREGVLILATGGAVHNLSGLSQHEQPPDWAAQFDDWIDERINNGLYTEMMNYRRLAPQNHLAHPTEEHLLPLFVAMGASASVENSRGRTLHRGWSHGSLSMAAYSFE